MPTFDEYLMRHSEHGILFIVEQIELVEGIRCTGSESLETRWKALISHEAKRLNVAG